MIINTMKYDTNKRWVIHNFSQQEVGNAWLLEKNSFEKKKVTLKSKRNLIPKWFIDTKTNVNLMESI
jgi:hypothetical protein